MPTSPIEEFRRRLDQHGSRIARVLLRHNPRGEGGTLVRFYRVGAAFDEWRDEEAVLDEWHDEEILNADAYRELRQRFARVEHNDAGDTDMFTVSVPRRRTSEVVQP